MRQVLGGGNYCPDCGLTAGHGPKCSIGKAQHTERVRVAIIGQLKVMQDAGLRIVAMLDDGVAKTAARKIIENAETAIAKLEDQA